MSSLAYVKEEQDDYPDRVVRYDRFCGVGWFTVARMNPVFRGKPESHWIEHLSFGDDEQVERWRDFGPEGFRFSFARWKGQTGRRINPIARCIDT